MNLIARLSIAGAMLASSTIYSAEPDDGWYVGLMVGASNLTSSNVSIVNSAPLITPFFPSFRTRFTNQIGFNGAGYAGYRWCENYRLEGEIYANFNNLERIQLPGIGPIRRHLSPLGFRINGNTIMVAGLFNGYYDFYIPGSDSSLVPYAGIGIGYAYLRTKFELYRFRHLILGSQLDRLTSAPIGQGILGVNYFFDESAAAGVDLRYLTTNTIKHLNNGRISVISFNFNLNFSFDQPMQ